MRTKADHMNSCLIVSSIVLSFVNTVEALEHAPQQKKEINRQVVPLSQIWAYNMPGTIDIADLGRRQAKSEGMKLLASISESSVLRSQSQKSKPAPRKGFAVVGNGLTAMRAAHAMMENEGKRETDFSPKDEITLVFFSEPATGAHVYLRRVERKGDNIEVQYQLEPYIERNYSFGFALIPLGRLPSGKYSVNLRELRAEKRHIQLGFKPFNERWVDQNLCKPFMFKVVKKK